MENITKYNLIDVSENPYCFDAVFELFVHPGNERTATPASDARSRARGGSVAGSYVRRGAPSANRRLPKYQRDFVGGFDGGFELAFYGEYEPNVSGWFRDFDSARERVRLGDEVAAYVDFFGFPVKINPAGARVGHLTYSYQFDYMGIRFLFHNSPCQDVPAVRVVVGAVPLLRASVQDVYSFILKFLNFAGVNIYREIVSRADLMIMTSDYSVCDFLTAMNNQCYTTRCRGKMAIYADLTSGKIESITLKSSRAELCIYDKLSEVVTKDATYYKWFLARFGGVLPPVLTRVEFRFRREALRYYGINKFSDLLNHCGALVEKFSSSWFRILSRSKVRGSEREIDSAPCWSTVQRLFSKVFGGDFSQPVLKAARSAVVKVDKLVKMAVGCIAKSCALLQRSKEPIKDVSDAVFDLVSPFFKTITEKRVSAALELSADGYYQEGVY